MDLTKSSFKLFVANIVTAGTQFLGIAVFARELGATQIGIFFLFQALLGLLAIPANFGLRGAVEKRISEGESQGAFLSSTIVLKAIPISVIILSIMVLRPYINAYLGADLAILLALTLILQEIAQLSEAILKGELRVGETAELRIAREVIWVIIAAVLVSRGFNAVGLVYGLMSGLGVMFIWGWYKSSVNLSRPSIEHARSLFDYGKYSVISSIGGYFYGWMDVAIIGLFMTQAHVGTYEIAWRVAAVSILFSRAIAMTIFPQVSEWDADGAQDRIENLLPTAITPSLILVIPAFFGTVLFSREILNFAFGPEYTAAWLVLILLMGDKVFQAIQLIIGRSLQALNRPDLAARATIVSVLLNTVLNLFLVWRFGILGAAVATVISSVANDFLHFVYLRRFIPLRFPHHEILASVFASIGMVVVLVIFGQIYQAENLITLLVVIGVGAISYFVFVLLSPTLRPQILEISERLGISLFHR